METPTDSVPNCDMNYGLTEELEVGKYNYKVEIRPVQGTGCTKDITGDLDITEGDCETVFINYNEVFAN